MPASLKISKVGLVTKPQPLGCCQCVDRFFDGRLGTCSIRTRWGAMDVIVVWQMYIELSSGRDFLARCCGLGRVRVLMTNYF
jgi:hypothetical protein